MSQFKELSPSEINGKLIEKISKEWMLLAAERDSRVNMMTASWGGLGFIWNKPVSFTFFRPQRFTLDFVNSADTFSMTFFDEEFRSKLNLCGTKSGRDIDKVKECGFEVLHEAETPYFAEAKLALICKKLYVQRLDASCFIENEIDTTHYPKKDYHYMFVSEIIKAMEQ